MKTERPRQTSRNSRLGTRRWRSGHLAVVALFLAAACDRTPPPPPLSRLVPGEDWVAAVSRDSVLSLRLPPAYRGHDEAPCWATPLRGREEGSRSVCVSFDTVGEAGLPRLRATPWWSFETDAYTMRGFAEERMRIHGRPAVVQRALMSGGIGGETDSRRMLVLIQFGPDQWAVVRGSVGDDAGYDEFLAIAHTVQRRP